MTVERIVCNSFQLVGEVASLLRPRAVEKGLTLDVQYIGFCPATIRTDPTRLRQILMTLLGNAVKFTPRGGIRLVIELLTTDSESPKLQFRVIDTGIGMNPEQLAHLFEPFTQVDISSAGRLGGTGLGLTISKHFAIMLGGSITVKTEIGHGSVFTVEIETGSLRGVPMLERPAECGDTGAGKDLGPLPNLAGRILLAEDGSDNQKLISSFLREAGAQVTVVENGRLARDAISEAARARLPFDVVLMDVQMAEMDGCTAASAIRNNGFKMPMIALTAYAILADRDRCLTAGFNAFVTKPIDWESLLKLIAGYLRPQGNIATLAKAS
jgi:Amt family ammonium transporter